jgi:hypothetical protein
VKKKTKSQIGDEVSSIMGAAHKVASPVRKALAEMEELVYPGAREVATLTVAARSLDWQFKPVMEALQIASKIEDWSHAYMVAETIGGDKFGPSFSWKTAPYRKYKSFKHFYKSELEKTFGSWAKLQRTWNEVVEGKITEDEGRRIIVLGKHGGDHGNQYTGGKRQPCDDENGTRLADGEYGTRDHWLARLDDKRPDLAAKVRADTMSANAAAIEAGYRKKRASRKLTLVDRMMKLWGQASKIERAEFYARIK